MKSAAQLACAMLAALLCLFSPLQAEDAKPENVTPSAASTESGATENPGGAASAMTEVPTETAASIATAAATTIAAPPKPPITLVLKADLAAQRLSVVVSGKTKYVWPISSGTRGYGTPTGTFRPTWMARTWFSRQYDDAPMPHSIFFNRGIAFHGTIAVGSLGRPASHGCVRLAPGNAARLYALVQSHGLDQTRVIVHGKPKYREPAVARRAPERPGRYAGSPFAYDGGPAVRQTSRGGYYRPGRYVQPASTWPF